MVLVPGYMNKGLRGIAGLYCFLCFHSFLVILNQQPRLFSGI